MSDAPFQKDLRIILKRHLVDELLRTDAAVIAKYLAASLHVLKRLLSEKEKWEKEDDPQLSVELLSARARRVLMRADVRTIRDLKRISIAELLGCRNCGEVTCEELSAWAKSFGVTIRGARKTPRRNRPPRLP